MYNLRERKTEETAMEGTEMKCTIEKVKMRVEVSSILPEPNVAIADAGGIC